MSINEIKKELKMLLKKAKVNDHWLKPVACRKGKPYVD